MMDFPQVSVIVPNYNHAPFLEERIQSILNQTYTNFELILLDDCSTDNSKEILFKYGSNPHVSHIVINETNSGGVFNQWTKGISLAKGKYIWIAESDDKADPLFLETLIKPMEENPTASVCFGGSYLIDQDGHFLYENWDYYWIDNSLKEGEVRVFDGLEYLKHSSSWYCCVYNASSAIFRRKYFDQIDKKYLSFKYCGDWYFWTEMCRMGEYIEVIKKLNYFRQSKLRTFPKGTVCGDTYKEDLLVIEHILNLLPMNWYRRNMLLGHFLRRIRREHMIDEKFIPEVYQDFETRFGSKTIPYCVERVNKLLSPLSKRFLLPHRDRL